MTNTETLRAQLDLSADPIPVLTPGELGAQGDVLLIPATGKKVSWRDVPAEGLVIVAGTHDHMLIGDACWLPAGTRATTELTIGWVSTGSGGAHLLHVGRDGRLSGEHGTVQIGSGGVWEVRGQRETAREGGWRRVAD